MKNLNFKALVAKMDALQETEQGKLKGGIRAIVSAAQVISGDTNNSHCNSHCG